MREILRVAFVLLVMLMVTKGVALAATINIIADQDTYIIAKAPFNNYGYSSILSVQDTLSFSIQETMLGFDVSDFLMMNPIHINSVSINVFNTSTAGAGYVGIAMGNNDTWDANAVTWNTSAGDYGPIITEEKFYSIPLNLYGNYPNIWRSWDVSSIGLNPLLDGYVTFYMTPNLDWWISFVNFSSMEGYYKPYMTIDYEHYYTTQGLPAPSQKVPEPSIALNMMMGMGLLLISVVISKIKQYSSLGHEERSSSVDDCSFIGTEVDKGDG